MSRFCWQLARKKVFLSVDRIVLLFCYRKLPEVVLVALVVIGIPPVFSSKPLAHYSKQHEQ